MELEPPPPAASGMENRTTRELVGARVVHWTYSPVASSVTARRPDASPARSPTTRFGPTATAPPPVTPSSASYVSKGMFAPRPMNSDCVTSLFARRASTSVESGAAVIVTS